MLLTSVHLEVQFPVLLKNYHQVAEFHNSSHQLGRFGLHRFQILSGGAALSKKRLNQEFITVPCLRIVSLICFV